MLNIPHGRSFRHKSIPFRRTNVVALNRSLWCPETETDILEPSPATLSYSLGLSALSLRVGEDVRLLLVSALALDCQFGGHVVDSVAESMCGGCCVVVSSYVVGSKVSNLRSRNSACRVCTLLGLCDTSGSRAVDRASAGKCEAWLDKVH